jgi:hypothetical protein
MKMLLAIFLVGFLELTSQAGWAQVYDLGQFETKILGLGRDGTLVGQMDLFNGFIKRPGKDVELVQYPGSIATAIAAIDSHCILGSFTSLNLDIVGFKQCEGHDPIIYAFGLTLPTAMHADGTVVGYYSPDGGFTWSGFIQRGTQAMHPFTVPGATSTRIFAMDEHGRIGGDFNDAKGEHGFVWDGSTLKIVDVKHSVGTVVTGLNSGCILGAFDLRNGNQKAFVRCGDQEDLPILVGGSVLPRALLPNGTIGGFFYDDAKGAYRGFVLRKFAEQ